MGEGTADQRGSPVALRVSSVADGAILLIEGLTRGNRPRVTSQRIDLLLGPFLRKCKRDCKE